MGVASFFCCITSPSTSVHSGTNEAVEVKSVCMTSVMLWLQPHPCFKRMLPKPQSVYSKQHLTKTRWRRRSKQRRGRGWRDTGEITYHRMQYVQKGRAKQETWSKIWHFSHSLPLYFLDRLPTLSNIIVIINLFIV